MLLILANGGFGNWGGCGNNAVNNGALPYMAFNGVDNDVQRGFNHNAVMDSLNSISSNVQNGFAGVNTNLCNGFAGVNQNISSNAAGTNLALSNGFAGGGQALCNGFGNTNQAIQNGFAQNEIAANSRQMANMQQAFNQQTATLQGFNGVAQQLGAMQNNLDTQCCDMKAQNAANYADIKYTVATENCNDRYEAANNTRDIIQNNTSNTQNLMNIITNGFQSMKEEFCQDRLDAVNRENANLRTQINMLSLQASQTEQTARLLDNNNAQTAAILAGQAQRASEVEQYVNPTPIPAYTVQNPNCCSAPVNACNY